MVLVTVSNVANMAMALGKEQNIKLSFTQTGIKSPNRRTVGLLQAFYALNLRKHEWMLWSPALAKSLPHWMLIPESARPLGRFLGLGLS